MNAYNEDIGEDLFPNWSELLDPRASRLQVHKRKNKSTKWLWNHFRSLVRLLSETDCIPSNIDWTSVTEYDHVRFSIQKTQESTRIMLDWYPKDTTRSSRTFLLPHVDSVISQRINDVMDGQRAYRAYVKWPRKQKQEQMKEANNGGRNMSKMEMKNIAFLQAIQATFQTTNRIIPHEKVSNYFEYQIQSLQDNIKGDTIQLDKETEQYYREIIQSDINSSRRSIQSCEYLKWIFQEIGNIWILSWLYANKRKWLGKLSRELSHVSRVDKNFPEYLMEISDTCQRIIQDAGFFYQSHEDHKMNEVDGVVSMNKRSQRKSTIPLSVSEDLGYIEGLEELQDEEYLLTENGTDIECKEAEGEIDHNETLEDEYVIGAEAEEEKMRLEIWNKLQFSSGLSEFFDLKKSERNPFMQRIAESLLEVCTSNSEFMEGVESELGYFRENIPAILEKSENLEDPMDRTVFLYDILHNNAFHPELYNFYQGHSLSRVLEQFTHRLSQKIPQFHDILSLLDSLLYHLDNGNFGKMVGDGSYWGELLNNEEYPWDIMLMRFGLIENTVRKRKENGIIDNVTYSEVMGCIEEMKQLVRSVVPLNIS